MLKSDALTSHFPVSSSISGTFIVNMGPGNRVKRSPVWSYFKRKMPIELEKFGNILFQMFFLLNPEGCDNLVKTW